MSPIDKKIPLTTTTFDESDEWDLEWEDAANPDMTGGNPTGRPADAWAANRVSYMLSCGLETRGDSGELLNAIQASARSTNEFRAGEPLSARGGEPKLSRFIRKPAEANVRSGERRDQLTTQVKALNVKVAQRSAPFPLDANDLAAICYTLAHDLRTPLRNLLERAHPRPGNVGVLDKNVRNQNRQITRAETGLNGGLQDFLRYCEISSWTPACEIVSLERCVAEAVGQRFDLITSKRAEVLPHYPLPKVQADAAWLRESFGHLLDNALTFVAPGVLPRVRIWCESGSTMARVYVADNGIGIPPEHHQRIFGLFQRLSAEHPGTGVGLALVRRAAERMRGQAGVESAPGKGSLFWMDLPKAD